MATKEISRGSAVTKSDVIEALTGRVAEGNRLSDGELASLEPSNVLALGMLAEAARRRAPREVTYARVQHVAGPGAIDFSIADAASEVRVTTTPASFDEALALVAHVRAVAGAHRRVTAFSLSELQERAAHGWGEVSTVARALAGAGLDDLAEIPVDRLDALAEAVREVRGGGLPAGRFTVDQPAGDRRLALVTGIRRLQETLGGVRRFAPLARRPATDVPTTGYDDLRTIALARLALGHLTTTPAAVSIEVDWAVYGPKLAQVALVFGADHLDAVAATSDPSLGARRDAVQDVERNIRAAGFEPVAVGRRSE